MINNVCVHVHVYVVSMLVQWELETSIVSTSCSYFLFQIFDISGQGLSDFSCGYRRDMLDMLLLGIFAFTYKLILFDKVAYSKI